VSSQPPSGLVPLTVWIDPRDLAALRGAPTDRASSVNAARANARRSRVADACAVIVAALQGHGAGGNAEEVRALAQANGCGVRASREALRSLTAEGVVVRRSRGYYLATDTEESK